MNLLVAVLAAAVATFSALRSTWSPCGLSRLSTITPLAERGRGRRYGATATWFIAGSLLGGLCLGACIATLAAAVAALHLSATVRTTVAVVFCVLAAASDAGIRRMALPVHHRQVNERWLDQFRPWVYGAGFGWQIGTGLATYVTNSGVYLLIVLGSLTADPGTALALGALFGAVRGLAVLLGRGITTPESLRAFHRRLTRFEPTAHRVVEGVELASSAILLTWVWWPAALSVGVVAMVIAVGRAQPGHRPSLEVSVEEAATTYRCFGNRLTLWS